MQWQPGSNLWDMKYRPLLGFPSTANNLGLVACRHKGGSQGRSLSGTAGGQQPRNLGSPGADARLDGSAGPCKQLTASGQKHVGLYQTRQQPARSGLPFSGTIIQSTPPKMSFNILMHQRCIHPKEACLEANYAFACLFRLQFLISTAHSIITQASHSFTMQALSAPCKL